jgi:hypothetical protein
MVQSLFTFTIVSLVLGIGSSVLAQDRTLELFAIDTVNAQRYQVLQCPANDQALQDFRNKLLQIKKDISQDSECESYRSEANASIDGLGSLVTTGRNEFLDLVTKGQVEGLNAAGLTKIEKYVEDLTLKTSNLINILAGSDGCFDEDKKGSTIGFVTSLIGEASKVLSVIGGPQIGGLVSVASSVITGFSSAIQTINENKQGYDFSDPEQKLAYADSLCALFDYRRELDTLMDPYETTERINDLMIALNTQITKLYRNCSECAALITLVDTQVNLVSRNGLDEIVDVGDIWTPELDAQVSEAALAIDQLYTNRVGTHTYRALKTRTWLPIRARSLESTALVADLGLADVLTEVDNVERFMVNRQADEFVWQLIEDAEGWKEKMLTGLTTEGEYLALQGGFMPESYWTDPMWSREVYFQAVLEGLDRAARENTDRLIQAKIRSYLSTFKLHSQGFNVSVDVASRYCTFFENSNWYRFSISRVCPNKDLQALQQEATLFTGLRLLLTSDEGAASEILGITALSSNIEVSADWVESLTRSVTEMTQTPTYIKRQYGAPTPLFNE